MISAAFAVSVHVGVYVYRPPNRIDEPFTRFTFRTCALKKITSHTHTQSANRRVALIIITVILGDEAVDGSYAPVIPPDQPHCAACVNPHACTLGRALQNSRCIATTFITIRCGLFGSPRLGCARTCSVSALPEPENRSRLCACVLFADFNGVKFAYANYYARQRIASITLSSNGRSRAACNYAP